jgi:hypothetical protein
LLVSFPISANVQLVNGSDYYKLCSGYDPSQIPGACEGYVTAFLDGGHMQTVLGGGKKTWCIPKSVNSKAISTGLASYLSDHENQRSHHVSVLLSTYLMFMWPC